VLSATGPPTAATSPARLQLVLFALLLALSLWLALRAYGSFQLGAYRDDAVYVLLARSLAFESTYAIPGAPLTLPVTRFPFGFPLALKPFALAAPDRLDLYALPSLLATALNCGLIFWGWRWLAPGMSSWLGLAVVALYGSTPLTVGHAGMVMSEPLFTTYCLAALILAGHLAGRKPAWPALLGLGALLALAVATRTIGLALVLAVLASLYLARPGRLGLASAVRVAALAALSFGLLAATQPLTVDDVVPWKYIAGWQRFVPSDPLPQRFARAIPEYALEYVPQAVVGRGFSRALVRQDGPAIARPLRLAAGLAVSSLVLIGLGLYLRCVGWRGPLLFALIYAGVALVWPYRAERVLYPLLPLLFVGLLLGSHRVLSWLGRRARLPRLVKAAPKLTAGLAVGLVVLHATLSAGIQRSWPDTRDLPTRSAWLAAHAEPGAIFLSEDPIVDGLYAGRPGVQLLEHSSGEELLDFAGRYDVRYVLIGPELPWRRVGELRLTDIGRQARLFLDQLVTEQRAELAFSDEPSLVRVYRLR
jgi:hypothetical protein